MNPKKRRRKIKDELDAHRLLKLKNEIRKFLRESGSLQVLGIIQSRIRNCNVSSDRFFKWIFTHFYQLDHAFLSDKFLDKYFELLQKYKNRQKLAVTDIDVLAEKLRKTSDKKLQASFISKLCATINPDFPILDSKIRTFYKLRPLPKGNFNHRINKLRNDLNEIKKRTAEIFKEKRVAKMIKEIRNDVDFDTSHIPDLRIIDLIIYAYEKSKS